MSKILTRIKYAVHVLLGRPLFFGIKFPKGYVLYYTLFEEENEHLALIECTFERGDPISGKMMED